MPSLSAKNVKFIKRADKRGRIYFEVIAQENEETNKSLKMGNTVFYGFPLEYSGKIEAVISKEKLVHLENFDC